jgi:TonB family protein
VSHPRLRSAVAPVYPPIARSAFISGTVIIEAIIDDTGRVSDATITRSVPLLDTAALDAVRRWQFETPPWPSRGVRFATTITVEFRLYHASAPLPSLVSASASDVPVDFAVVYSYGCPTGMNPGHAVSLSPAPIMATLTTATHDLRAVYLELSAAALFTRTEGLLVWDEPRGGQTTVSDKGVLRTVSETRPFLCSDQLGSPQYALSVRRGGKWQRLWPPMDPKVVPTDYEKQLARTRALIQRAVAGN